MANNTNQQSRSVQFDKIRISLASPDTIRGWSHGEVKKPETINYRTLKPEPDGLFCEKIFGPTKDYECHCGKYKKPKDKGKICDKCGVEVTKSSVRRERMGHIELASPVSHIWYFKGVPSKMATLLDIPPKKLESVLYFAAFVVLDPGTTTLEYKQVLDHNEYFEACSQFGKDSFRVGMGAEAVKELLCDIDIEAEDARLREEYAEAKSANAKKDIVKKLTVVEAFMHREGKPENRPEWMILDVLPVLPPDLRPMVQLDGGRFATSDLNDLYRRIINRNNRLKKLIDLNCPDIIVRNEKRMLQDAVDALIDNGRNGRSVSGGQSARVLKSLAHMLKGKQGRFRQNLLGKRVDYSGRSVIVVGPELKIYQCGLPKEIAIELFKPFVMRELFKNGYASNVKAAKKMVERLDPQVWDILEDVIREHPVMLNRAPTLHRLSVQAFEPILVEGRAIKLHPLVCMAFNADFDGDQMAVHLPLSAEAQAECRFLLLSPNNLIKPSDGGVVSVPSQDMVLGIYFLTNERYREVDEADAEIVKFYDSDDEAANIEAIKKDLKAGKVNEYDVIKVRIESKKTKSGEVVAHKDICTVAIDMIGRRFASFNKAMLAYENDEITLQQIIYVRREKKLSDGTTVSGTIRTTLGRLIFNEIVPQDLGFVDRKDPENAIVPEINELATKKTLKKILDKCIKLHGSTKTAEVLDDIKSMGYKYSTLSGISVSVADMTIPESKGKILGDAQETVDQLAAYYQMGLLTEDERYRQTIKQWENANNQLTKDVINGLDRYNNIFMMADSGARGSDEQIKQLSGMRGNMSATSGKTIELPIKSNLREGLDVLEYFISAHGARKALSDTALKTADSGYMTRRLVDVSQELIIRETDCTHGIQPKESNYATEEEYLAACREAEEPGIYVSRIMNSKGKNDVEPLQERITGRYAARSIFNAEGEMLVKVNHMITEDRAERIIKEGLDDEGVPFTTEITDANGVTTVGVRPDAKIKIRSILTCNSKIGVCARCYGRNLATGQTVQIGEAVGIIAAQSIGEPGTQLTMRNFHSGGVASAADITQGLPRVNELFEAQEPKGIATIAEFDGTVSVEEAQVKDSLGETITQTVVTVTDENGKSKKYDIPSGAEILVKDGDSIGVCDKITEGPLNPSDILNYLGVEAVQNYILSEIQKVYRSQGVEISDKHIELIVRQMLRKVKIDEPGDSAFLPGALVDVKDFVQQNEMFEAAGLAKAEGTRIIQGITKAALSTNSFLSAASFQETTRVLTDAAINGKVDPLVGLKENVIIGNVIPAGTGTRKYRAVTLDTEYVNDIPGLDKAMDEIESETSSVTE